MIFIHINDDERDEIFSWALAKEIGLDESLVLMTIFTVIELGEHSSVEWNEDQNGIRVKSIASDQKNFLWKELPFLSGERIYHALEYLIGRGLCRLHAPDKKGRPLLGIDYRQMAKLKSVDSDEQEI